MFDGIISSGFEILLSKADVVEALRNYLGLRSSFFGGLNSNGFDGAETNTTKNSQAGDFWDSFSSLKK